MVSAQHDLATVNKGSDAIPLHREASYLPGQPDLVALYCEKPARAGGQTTLCDGVQLLRCLPPDVADYVADQVIIWHWRLPHQRWRIAFDADTPELALGRIEQMRDTFAPWEDFACTFGADGSMHGTYQTKCVLPTSWEELPAFVNSIMAYHYRKPGPYVAKQDYDVTLSDGSPFPVETLETIASHAELLTYELHWHARDMLVLDNSHMMHGRRAVTDQHRRILVRLGHYRA